MKKISFLALMTAGLLLGACSSDNDELSVNQTGALSSNGSGFVAVNINLPTAPAASLTRATNDNYDDGLANEYEVKSAILMLFDGTTEDNAKWVQDIDVYSQLQAVNDADNDNITTSYQVVAEVTSAIADQLYGLVILNYGGVYNPGNHTFNLSTGGTFDISAAGNTFATLKNQVFGNFDAQHTAANGFFMTNAILTTDKSNSLTAPAVGNIHILENLTGTLYKTQEEAKSNPAGSIFVERAVAKATLRVTPTTITSTTPLTILSSKWAINNTEPTSYIVRKAHTASLAYSSEAFGTNYYYRFVGDVAIGTTAIQPITNLYRTYWCEDPQYAADATLTRPANAAAAEAALKETGLDKPQYCNENTFDVAHQNYRNTTRAIIKVVTGTGAGTTFYTDNGNNEQYTLAQINSIILEFFIKESKIYNAIKALMDEGKTLTLGADMFTVNWTGKDANAKITVTGVEAKAATGWNLDNASGTWKASTGANETERLAAINAALTAAVQADAVAAANGLHTILEYTGGVVYYEARFEHFASTAYEKGLGTFVEATAKAQGDLAPWNCWETAPNKPAPGETPQSYPGTNAEKNYLGRYGMVRNNWYDVEVTAFSKIGSPVDPSITIDTPSTPDDKVDETKYISLKINVLSWAKRTQSWSF